MKQPSLVMIPHADKVSQIKLVKGYTGVSLYRRDTVGFSFNKDGILEQKEVDEPRRHYRGGYVSYISEADATNYYKYSSDFDNAAHAVSGTVFFTDNESVAPNGKLDAYSLMPLSETASDRFTRQNISSLPIGELTFSIYAKYKGQRYIRLTNGRSTSPFTPYSQSVFDLIDGSIISSTAESDIEDAGNGWYRISVTGTTVTSDGSFRINLGQTSLEEGSLEDGVLLWGGQVEESKQPSSHIETTSSNESRGGDELSIGISDDNDTHLSAYFNINLDNTGDDSSRISINDGTSNNAIRIKSQSNGTSIEANVVMDGESFSDIIDVGSYDNDIKIAFSLSDNLLSVSVNGEIVSTNTFTNLAFSDLTGITNADTSFTDNSTRFRGLINEIMYFPMTLSDSEINYITAN